MRIRQFYVSGAFAIIVGFTQTLSALNLLDSDLALTPAQIDVIQRVNESWGSMKTSVLRGHVAGIQRTVVFLGEVHYKSQADSNLGREVLEQFGAYGLEGADTSRNWGGKVFLAALYANAAMYKILSLGQQTHQSTIYEAWDKAKARRTLFLLERQIQEMNLARLSPEELAKVSVLINGKRVSGEKLPTLIHDLEQQASTEPLIFPLESGHKPAMGENVVSLAFPVMVGWGLYSWGSGAKHLIRTTLRGNYKKALVFLGASALPSVGLIALMQFFPENPINKALGVWTEPLITGRNKTMTQNLVKAFEDHPELSTLLVVVGRDHVSGMQGLLEQGSGFEVLRDPRFESTPTRIESVQ